MNPRLVIGIQVFLGATRQAHGPGTAASRERATLLAHSGGELDLHEMIAGSGGVKSEHLGFQWKPCLGDLDRFVVRDSLEDDPRQMLPDVGRIRLREA